MYMESSCVKKSDFAFGAKPILKTSVIKKITRDVSEFVPIEANIVELDLNNAKDAIAIATLKNNWANGRLTEIICSPFSSEARKLYAVTSQNTNFENIDTNQILGLADCFIKDGNANLRFLQAKPEFVDNPNRTIKNIGASLVQGLTEKFKLDGLTSLDVFAEQKLKPFYRKICPQIQDKESTMDSCTNLILYLNK